MKNKLLNKRLPTILGLLILILLLGAGAFVSYQKQLFIKNQPKPSLTPKEIHISNVSQDQVNISFVTDQPTSSFVKYGPTLEIGNLGLDDRDQLSLESGAYTVHYITIKNLSPGKTYYFKIGLGKPQKDNQNLFDNNGEPYSITIGSDLGANSESRMVGGRILKPDKTPASGAIVYFFAANMAYLSALTDENGRWVVFLNKARSTDFSQYAVLDLEATILDIEASNGLQKTSAKILTKFAFPTIPDLVLGHPPYDFRVSLGETPPQMLAEPSGGASPFPLISPSARPSLSPWPPPSVSSFPRVSPSSSPTKVIKPVSIDNPQEEGEQLNTIKPEFLGEGPSDLVLTVKIESTPYTATVTVDDKGEWRLTPPTPLDPGRHKITVTYTNADGEIQSISKSFVVLAAGESQLPALISTPSASMSPSPSPSPSLLPSPSPSLSVSPSPIVISSPIVSAQPTQPVTGSIKPTVIFSIFGVLLVVVGFSLLI